MDRPIGTPRWRATPWTRSGMGVGAIALALFVLFHFLASPERNVRMKRTSVTVATVERAVFHDFVPLRAKVVALNSVYLDALEGGRVEKILAQPGDRVSENQPLVILTNTELELDVLEREGRLIESITLLNILGLLDSPSQGSYVFAGEEVARAPEKRLTELRRAGVGFIFQSFNLIEDLTVAENVDVGMIYRQVPSAERKRRVKEALDRVGIAHRSRHLPQQLSGGQQQRVAIARAIVSKPRLLLADEPTGNLDTANGDEVMDMLTQIAKDGTTVVMVTHSLTYAGYAQRTVKLLDGRVVSETLLAA
jgi:putative ABC transport system ATP-binding protein